MMFCFSSIFYFHFFFFILSYNCPIANMCGVKFPECELIYKILKNSALSLRRLAIKIFIIIIIIIS